MRLQKRSDGTFDDEEEGQSPVQARQEDLSAALQEIRCLREKMHQLEEEHEFLLGTDRRALVDSITTTNKASRGTPSTSSNAMASLKESLENHQIHPDFLEDQLLLENGKMATSTMVPQSLSRDIVEDDTDASFESGLKKSGNRLNYVKHNRRVHFSEEYSHHDDQRGNKKDLYNLDENERIVQLEQHLAAEERTNRKKILTLESQSSSYRLEIERMKETLSKLEYNDSLMRASMNRYSHRSSNARSLFSGLGTGILSGPTVASSIVIHDEEYSNEVFYKINLDSDTFALMFVAKPCSQNWAIGLSAFAFQISLGAMILWNQIREGSDSSIFNVPFKVDLVVRTGQFLTIILCISTQSDILTSIQAFILFEKGGNWNASIGEDGNTSTLLWVTRVLIPNAMKLLQGLVVILTSYVIIVQSDNIITLLKDFTALMVLSETDNILFGMADYGYLGERLQIETRKVKMFEFEVNHESTVRPVGDSGITTEASTTIPFRDIPSKPSPRKPFCNQFCLRTTVILFLFIAKISCWLIIVIRQIDGTIFKYKYPDCVDQTTHESYFQLAKEHFFNEECYGGPLNSLGCKFEGGDCVNFNLAYPLCKGDDLKDVQKRVGDGVCHKKFATYECDFDGGDCCPYSITKDRKFGDGQCQAGRFATENCGFDNGDCNTFARKKPDCDLESLSKNYNASDIILGNDVCESGIYNSKKCGFEAGDCDEGQIGQDLLFSDSYTGNFLSFIAKMSRDGSQVVIARSHTWPRGIVEIFRYNSSMMKWTPAGKLFGAATSDRFGGSIAMNFGGSRIAIGAPKSTEKGSSTGSVQIYEINPISTEGWTQIGQTIQGIRDFSDTGYLVDLTHDGNRIAISSPSYSNQNVDNSGHIRVFDLHVDGHVSPPDTNATRKPQWVQVGDTIKGQDSSEMIGKDRLQFIGSDGSTIMFSANDVTRFCILSKEGKNSTEAIHDEIDFALEENPRWVPFSEEIQSPNSIAFASSANGKMIAISSNSISSTESGMVTIYQLVEKNIWKQVGDALVAAKSSIADGFGYDLAMSEDGYLLAISSIKRDCDLMIGLFKMGNEFCATGSVLLYSYDYISSRFRQVPPTKFEERERSRQESVFGVHLSMAGDKSKLSISGFNFRDAIDNRKNTGGFMKVYNLDEIFYPKCNVTNPEEIGDNTCQEILPHITKECGFDGGDCNEPKAIDGYPNCIVSNPHYLGSGTCFDIPPYFTAECGWDGGDCDPPTPIENYPDCHVAYLNILGNTQCDDFPPYNTEECGYDMGDCPIPNDNGGDEDMP